MKGYHAYKDVWDPFHSNTLIGGLYLAIAFQWMHLSLLTDNLTAFLPASLISSFLEGPTNVFFFLYTLKEVCKRYAIYMYVYI